MKCEPHFVGAPLDPTTGGRSCVEVARGGLARPLYGLRLGALLSHKATHPFEIPARLLCLRSFRALGSDLGPRGTKAETRRLPEKAEPAVGLKKLKMRPQVPPPGVAINPFPPSSLQTMSSLKGKNPRMHFLLKC